VTPDGHSDWDVYRFGLLVGARAFPAAPRHAVKRLLLPVEYIRYSEFRYVLEHLNVTADHRVLDIGSPKLLSLFLASRVGANIWATDLVDDFFPPYAAYAASMLGAEQTRYVIETQDARTLTYRDESFDRVFSVSVIEHIPDDGDARAMEEIARVLKPGGIACLTVPWSDRGYLEEFHAPGPDVYWVRSSEREKVFYQRAYDRGSLQARLLELELAGEVAAVGSEVEGLTVGDRVMVDPTVTCEDCHFCMTQRQNHCLRWNAVGVTRDGGFAEFVRVPAKN
jgi:SAM-dependent methyltransferase